MKEELDFSSLTDLRPDHAQHSIRCRCGSLARVASGLCVSCLLRSGLEPSETSLSSFEAILAAVDVPDRDWQLGNYRILEEVGRGGMGVIYRARHTPSRRIVALKRVLNYHSDSQETLTRFQAEARTAASLDHPNILPIYDVGSTEDGLPFFTMKFAVGGSLQSAKPAFRETPRRAAQLIAKVARAIDHAHAQGILHRDLKPGNILLDARGQPMVSDFGLAKWLENGSDLTRTLTVFGTPGYIAPEQAESPTADLTPATDVYSLGAILFELLSGRPPFLGEHAVAVLRQASENDAPKLRSIVAKASRDLETICARCLERDPLLRYWSAAALADDLERWLEGRPITARPISVSSRFYRWSRRNPFLACALAGCVLFGVIISTREVQNWKLQKQVRQNELIRNSVAVLPFLDLDSVTYQIDWTQALAQSLQASISNIGNARIVPAPDMADATTAIRNFGTRTALFGTRRKTEQGMRLSVQLLGPGGEPLFGRIVDLNSTSDLNPLAAGLAREIFPVLAANDWQDLVAAKTDVAFKNQSAHELITAGRELTFHYTLRDFDRAISCFEKAVQLEPRSALAHAYLASAAAARTHYVADENLFAYAEREVAEASRLAPNSAEVLRVLGGVEYQRGRFRQALEHGLRAMETDQPKGKSAAMLGLVYYELGRPDQALRWFGSAKRLDPRPGEFDCRIGDCRAALGDYDQARIAYQRANELHPERSEGLVGMAHLDLLNADFTHARNLCQQSTRLNPDGPENAQLAGQIEFFSRNFSQAQKIYRRLYAKDPNGGGTFHGGISYKSALGWLGLNGNDPGSAISLLTEALSDELKQLNISPDNPNVLYRIAAIEASLHQSESAIAHLQAAVDAGWIDYRSLSLDPRFDAVANDLRLQTIIGKLKLKTEQFQRATRDL